jgi:glycosyltransferase involved in cell wall biosynthesis
VVDEIDVCLSSLVAQTLASLEILVVNDGSPDGTGDKARAWQNKFADLIRVIDKPNGGCASARAAGLRAARGEFVGFVDADDWVDPPMYETLLAATAESDAEIAQCGYSEAFSDGSLVPAREEVVISGLQRDNFCIIDDPLTLLPLRPTIWRRIYRREFLQQNKIQFPEHIRRFDDLPFQFETFVCARRVAVVPGSYYAYRQDRPGQDIAVRDERFFVHLEIFDWLESRLSDRLNLAIERHLFRAELCSHVWALRKIEKGLRKQYYRAAVNHLSRPRAFLQVLDKLALGRSVSPTALRLVVDSLLRAPLTERSAISAPLPSAIEKSAAGSVQK